MAPFYGFFLLFSSMLVFPGQALAYLDAGSGSYLLQMLLAALLGGLYTIKLYWAKVKTFFSGSSSEVSEDEEGDK